MLEERYQQADRVVLVIDNLKTHGIESLYDTPQRRRHGRWPMRLPASFLTATTVGAKVADHLRVAQTAVDRRQPNLRIPPQVIQIASRVMNDKGHRLTLPSITAASRRGK